MSINQIPNPTEALAGNLRPTMTWYRFLRELAREARDAGADLSAEIEALARKLGSPDGTIAGIPAPADPQYVSAAEPLIAAGNRVSLATVTQEVSGDLLGIALDAWGRVTGSRPVVAGAGVTIDTSDPAQITITAAGGSGQVNRITTTGDFRRTTQNDLREIA